MASLDDFVEGEEYDLNDIERWSAVSPVRGMVMEVDMERTDQAAGEDVWAAFLVTQISHRLDGSMVARCRFLGVTNAKFAAELDRRFNKSDGYLHVCLSKPCIEIGTPAPADPNALHIAAFRLWKLTTFKDICDYVDPSIYRSVRGWLNAKDAKTPGLPKPKRNAASKAAAMKKGEAKEPGEKEKPKRERAIRKRRNAGAGEEPPPRAGKPAAREGKAEDLDAKRQELRRKLRETRERLQGKKETIEAIDDSPGTPDEKGDEDPSGGNEHSGSSYSEEAAEDLNTGAELGGLYPNGRASKEDKGKKTTRAKDEQALVALKGPTTGNWNSQLVAKALETTVLQKKQKKKKDKKDKANSGIKALTNALTAVLEGKGSATNTSSSKRKKKKKKKRKRKMLADGTIQSFSESSSDAGVIEEEAESSETDLEAPMRKKSRDHPGSVLHMLVSHVQEQLHQGALTDMHGTGSSLTGGVKVMSYFNLHVKPSYPHHLRELRELHHLAAVIDLLRSGDIGRVGDSLAARFVAIHQSMVDASWTMAKHLELHPMEEVSAAGPAAILATRKHAKLVEKVQGVPSTWFGGQGKGRGKGRPYYDQREAKGDGRNDKGKGKNRKGRDGKGGQPYDRWSRDWDKTKEKPEEKPKN